MKKQLEKRRLLFIGELPPLVLHGISIASEQILKILAERFSILHLIEKRDMGLTGWRRLGLIFRVGGDLFRLVVCSLRHRPHVLYTTFPTSKNGAAKCLLFILFFRSLGGGPVILHVHRGDLLDFVRRGRLEAWLLRVCFDRATRIIALSVSQAKTYSSLTGRPVSVIPNAVDVPPGLVWSAAVRSKLIFLSNYLPGKGLSVLLSACQELHHRGVKFELHCYGGGDSQSYQALVDQKGLHGVYLHGPLTGEEKFKVLSHSGIMVFPSHNEGQPLVILEAMAVGVPVVASKVGLIPEMLGEDYAFTVPPGNVESLATKIQELLQLSEVAVLSQNLRNRFEACYSPKIQRSAVLAVFGEFGGGT